ncbi:hypothetical protein PIB30_053521 [Stylosanthes scabra]|uniref:Pectin acetylesterase n=1 Tax=Stylosanthes scabra TaxID=79078 RepID=A0ABU6UKI3_9FABA|nr:hypothetical protein [Stylosanthes scabra]
MRWNITGGKFRRRSHSVIVLSLTSPSSRHSTAVGAVRSHHHLRSSPPSLESLPSAQSTPTTALHTHHHSPPIPPPQTKTNSNSLAKLLLPTPRRLKIDPSNKLFFPCLYRNGKSCRLRWINYLRSKTRIKEGSVQQTRGGDNPLPSPDARQQGKCRENKRELKLSISTTVLFLDVIDISGGHTLRNLYTGVVGLQGAQKNLPQLCTNHLDPTSCFFPQNLIASVSTPLFILNAAYDSWQVNHVICTKR